MTQHLNLKIIGRVQGVFFRLSAKKTADKMGIKGIVRNELDGSVHIEAEGTQANLKKFLNWCHQGPPLAEVEKIVKTSAKPQGYRSFLVSS